MLEAGTADAVELTLTGAELEAAAAILDVEVAFTGASVDDGPAAGLEGEPLPDAVLLITTDVVEFDLSGVELDEGTGTIPEVEALAKPLVPVCEAVTLFDPLVDDAVAFGMIVLYAVEFA